MVEKLDWDDISIVPEAISYINSRSEINIYDENGNLPLFTAPMDMVIDETNSDIFRENKINICLPRGIQSNNEKDFISFGLDEIIEKVENNEELPKRVLIDIANGHMKKLMDIAKIIKEKYDVELMVGNIANPKTYLEYAKIGVDYIRVGIGAGCFTPNSLVNTKDGLKKISEIIIGDEVLTHNNRYKKVINTLNYDRDEELIKINDEIECTKNHEFYVIKKSDKNIVTEYNYQEYAIWIRADELTNDYLMIKL